MVAFLSFVVDVFSFMYDNAYWIVLVYYLLFAIVGSPMGKSKQEKLVIALGAPTAFVVVGFLVSLILALLATSGDCHPAHGWACETPPDFTFRLWSDYFKGVVVFVQGILALVVIAGLCAVLFCRK